MKRLAVPLRFLRGIQCARRIEYPESPSPANAVIASFSSSIASTSNCGPHAIDTTKPPGLAEELRLAQEEAARLDEMIALIGNSMDESKVRQLHVDLRVVRRIVAQLAEGLAKPG